MKNEYQVLVVVNSYENTAIHDLLFAMFGQYLQRGLTVRNQTMIFKRDDFTFNIRFFSWQSNIMQIGGLHPDITIIQRDVPDYMIDTIKIISQQGLMFSV